MDKEILKKVKKNVDYNMLLKLKKNPDVVLKDSDFERGKNEVITWSILLFNIPDEDHDFLYDNVKPSKKVLDYRNYLKDKYYRVSLFLDFLDFKKITICNVSSIFEYINKVCSDLDDVALKDLILEDFKTKFIDKFDFEYLIDEADIIILRYYYFVFSKSNYPLIDEFLERLEEIIMFLDIINN